MGVRIGLSHWRRNIDWGCSRTGCWGWYLGLRGTRVEKTTQRGASSPVLFTKYYPGDQIKNNEVSWACGTYGRQKRCTQGFGGETWKRQLERPRVDERIILKLISKKWHGDMNWIRLAQDGDKWRAVVHAVMNRRVPRNAGISWLAEDLFSFWERTLLHVIIWLVD